MHYDLVMTVYSIDHHLKNESVGRAECDPTGRWIVWEYGPPYDTQPDFSIGHAGTWQGAYRLMVIDLQETNPTSRPLFEPEPESQYWFDSFSPDGRFVAFCRAEHGRLSMGAVEIETKRVYRFAGSPDFDWADRRQSTWVAPDAFVFTAYRDDAQSLFVGRRTYGEFMAAAWQTTWRGAVPSVTVASSHRQPLKTPVRPGVLVRASAADGSIAPIAEGFYNSLFVSHQGRYLAALRQAERLQPEPERLRADWVQSRSELVIFDLAQESRMTEIAPGTEVYPFTLAWSPDADRLAFFGWESGEGVQSGTFRSYDVASGVTTAYPHRGLDLASERERGWYQKPERVVWIGERLAMFARENEPGDEQPRLTYRDVSATPGIELPKKADWFVVSASGEQENLTAAFALISAVPLYADGRSLCVLADGAVWRVSPNAAPVNISAPVSRTLALASVDRYARLNRPFRPTTMLVSRSDETLSLAFVDLLAGSASELLVHAPEIDPLASSAQRSTILYRQSGEHDVLMLQRPNAPAIVLQRFNAHLATVEKASWARISYAVHGNGLTRTLENCILLPPDYTPARRYPVIVEVYPSRGARMRPGIPYDSQEGYGSSPTAASFLLLAGAGYIVYLPNLSRPLTATREGPINDMPGVVVQGLDELVRLGYADPERFGLTGFSQGGFSSLYVATQTDRFKALVTWNSWADMYEHYYAPSYMNRLSPGEWPYSGAQGRYLPTVGTAFGIGKTPQAALDTYVRNSPLFLADKITTPTLLIHSDMDVFDLYQYEQMFTALYRQRKEAKLLMYWGEGHSPSSPANIRHAWENTLTWFDTYLDVQRDPTGAMLWEGNRVKTRAA